MQSDKRNIILILLFVLVQTTWAQKVRVSCIGNSITYGYGMQDPVTESYPAHLQTMLGESYEVGRFGRSGATLLNHGHRPYTKTEEYQQAMAFKGDIAVIHLGINDTDPRDWPMYQDEFIPDYCALVDSVRKANPKCRVILALMTPLSDRHHRFLSGTRDWHRNIQECIRRVAELKKCELVDFYSPFKHRPELFPDKIHPNKEGYRKLAEVVYRYISGNYGGLQLPPYFTDKMVLPRNRSFVLNGMANAGEKVMVTLIDETKSKSIAKLKAVAGKDGTWQVEIPKLSDKMTYTLKAEAASRSITLHGILAGELWLASGQSNMAFMLKQGTTAQEDIAAANNSRIRLLDIRPRWETYATVWSPEALDSINNLLYYHDAVWKECTPQNVPLFSAVGYHFARTLQDSLQCPIGIICNAVGGSGEEAWIDRETLEWEFPEILRDWTENDFIQDWVRGRASLNMGWQDKNREHNPLQRHPYQPCYLYEASIRLLRYMPITGVIWYQGESNAQNMETHARLFPLLLQSWRQTWNNPTLPFIYTQLSSLNRPTWPYFRDLQRQQLYKVNNETTVAYQPELNPTLGMAVTSDVGDSLDVHPRNKRPVGDRLARWALHNVYGHDCICSGPLYRSFTTTKNRVIVSFDFAERLHTSDGKDVRTVEYSVDGVFWKPADATIENDRLVIETKDASKVVAIRYGWQPFTRANLVNGDDLPASTFKGFAYK